MKKAAYLFSVILFSLLFSTTSVLAGGAVYYPSTGTDATGDSPASLSSTDMSRVKSTDEDKITTADWPDNNYNDNKYVEFKFNGAFNLAANARITSFKLIIVYQANNTSLAASKLKVYEKENNLWHEEVLGVPTQAGIDTTFTTRNLSSHINTADDLNNLIVRFYAYDQSTTSTSINQLRADIAYEGEVTGGELSQLPVTGSHNFFITLIFGVSLVSLGIIFKRKTAIQKYPVN